jgi:hypothetical protein
MLKPTSVFAAMAEAEKAALEHVGWLCRRGVPLDEVASAIGLDPDYVRGWDQVTV